MDLMDLLVKIFSLIFGGKTAKTREAKKSPTFLLPETAEEYKRKLGEVALESAALRQQAQEKRQQAKKLSEAGESPAQRELNRREAERMGWSARDIEYSLRDKKEKSPKEIECELRQWEAQKIAHQGQILRQTWDESQATKSGACFGCSFPHKKERRLVRFDGRVFLVQLEWSARTREVTHSSGGRYNGAWTEYVPTGEFKPPVVVWATDSVAQMTESELRSIA